MLSTLTAARRLADLAKTLKYVPLVLKGLHSLRQTLKNIRK